MTDHDIDLDDIFKRLHLANARRIWRDLVQRAEKESLGYEAFLRELVTEEVAHRKGTRLRRKTAAAGFPFLKTIDEFDFTLQASLRLATLGSFLTHDFVTEGRSLILHGRPGRGENPPRRRHRVPRDPERIRRPLRQRRGPHRRRRLLRPRWHATWRPGLVSATHGSRRR